MIHLNIRQQLKIILLAVLLIACNNNKRPNTAPSSRQMTEPDKGVERQFALHTLQLIVLSQISKSPQNAIWHLFSGQAQQFRYGHQHYHWHLPEEKIALNQLYELYQIEEVNMSYTWDDFKRDFTKEHLHLLKNDEILQRFSPEERLKGLAPDEHLKGLTPEMIKKYLSKLK